MEGIITMIVLGALVFGGISMFTALTNSMRQGRQVRSRPESGAQSGPARPAAPARPEGKPAGAQTFTTFDTAHNVDKQGWDSHIDFHEGEDPCHDDMESVPAPAPAPSPNAAFSVNDIAKGFVIGEILNRKRR